MDLSTGSLSNTLANLATGLKAQDLGYQISVAVLKQALEQQERQGAALIAMSNRTPSPEGTGRSVDVSI